MRKILLSLMLLLSMNCAYSQFSKTHYIPPLSSGLEVDDQYLYLSTPSLTPVNFRIIQIGATDITGTVSRDVPYVHNIGYGDTSQLNVPSYLTNIVLSDKGYIIEAEDMIYVSARVRAGGGNHAGQVVSKGLAALGTQFRIGAFVNTLLPNYIEIHYTFVSVLATENNTTVTFSDIGPGASLANNGAVGSNPVPVILNAGQSFVMAVQGPTLANRDALIGALVSSDKPIVVNCGSYGGSNGQLNNLDLGFDQLVSAERTGKDYIFIKSSGHTEVEKVLIVAHEDNTEIYLSGSTTPSFTINAGDYVAMDGNYYTPAGNLYVRTSKNTFAYQGVGRASDSQANQELFFVPPLSCETPKIIDNIPFLSEIGPTIFDDGRLTLVTTTGSDLNFVLNGTSYILNALPAGIVYDGPNAVEGNIEHVTYTITGLYGNLSVTSTGPLYVASYGSAGAATFGGFYSGFTFKPEVAFSKLDAALENCIPNVELSVSILTAFDQFQWYFNDVLIPGATNRNLLPTLPGYYHVAATIASCGTTLVSDKIPVSACPNDMDGDYANDNIDIDNDNDGIANCAESFGDQSVQFLNNNSGVITAGTYNNTFTTSFPPANGMPAPAPFTGNPDGSFITSTTTGRGNSNVFNINFAQPVSIAMEYVTSAAVQNLINSQSEFIISVPVNTTITVLNPSNQLLIDTNYDGIYESGITEFSSFEIRFRVNSATPLAAGTGNFSFRAYLAGTFRFTHINLNDSAGTNATFRILATCIPTDHDGDGIADQIDYDSDNDGVPDFYESQGLNFSPLSGLDSDNDGLDDIFENGFTIADSDSDGVPDYHDLDSDNNGIFDYTESGTTAPDLNNNGIIDGSPAAFGTNGLANATETTPDSGVLNVALSDTDGDGIYNFVDPDNDGDACNDVREAGFADNNNDGYLGNSTNLTVNAAGMVTGSGGYTTPNPDYIVATPILIASQPQDISTCEAQNAVFTVTTNPGVTFRWQISSDGITFTNLVDGPVYSGTTTNTLTVNSVTPAMDGTRFRVQLELTGNACGLPSGSAVLNIKPLPPIVTKTLVQCDTGTSPDGITLFSLAEANAMFTAGDPNLQVEYYASVSDADASMAALANEYTNLSNPQAIVARITNLTTLCFSYSTLILSANLLPNQVLNLPQQCDSDGTEDGFFEFNLNQATIPVTQAESIRYYHNETDALLEQNQIVDPQAYTNTTAYALESIIARVENESTESCMRLYQINIKVDPLPNILENTELEPFVVCVNTATFSTVLDAAIQDGSSPEDYSYQWFLEGDEIQGATDPTLTVAAEGLYSVVVTDANGCSKTRFIPVISSSTAIIDTIAVTDLSEYNTVTVTLSDNSYGDYVYSLDHQTAFQQSNVFTNVMMGNHIVYVKDLNGCPIASQVIYVLGIPPYFTPNADGFHDTWNVRGSGPLNVSSLVYIYDRYGKLIRQINPGGAGWDGTYQGYALPSDDYWYVVFLADGRTLKGHFALKR